MIRRLVRTAVIVSAAATCTLASTAHAQQSFRVGEPFPVIALPDMNDGTPSSIADFRGKKIVLHVFAAW